MGKWRMLLLVAIAAQSCVVLALPIRAADLRMGPPAVVAGDAGEAADDYLRRRAVLLMIRATFDLLLDEDVPRVLAGDIVRIGTAGPSEGQSAQLDRDLLAEGSYYLVSLRYLAETGGAVWPNDRPESSYANDALVTLDGLQNQLIDAINERTDPLPIFEEAQRILALSEGFSEVPASLDHFDGRDVIVEEVLADHGPTTNS